MRKEKKGREEERGVRQIERQALEAKRVSTQFTHFYHSLALAHMQSTAVPEATFCKDAVETRRTSTRA